MTDEGGGTTTGDAASTSGSTTAAQVEPDPGSDGSDGSTTAPPSIFLTEPDGGNPSFECDFFTQDCPPGFKCSMWANDGGSTWNATRCVPIAPDPAEPGEPCTVEGDSTSGIDTCELGAICWDVDPETNEGICVAYCRGDPSNPVCEDPNTSCEGRDIALCLPVCCPLEQNCPEGQACYGTNDTFHCIPDASGDLGAFGDPCEYINVCDPGLMCANAESVPDCAGAIGCCTPFCVVGSSSCSVLDPAMECVPWFEDGNAPTGFELTGLCILPQ